MPGNEPESWSYGLFVPHDPRAVSVARTTLRGVLRAARFGEVGDTAELLVTELVTNAYRNSAAEMYVAMDGTPDEFLVTVFDSGPGMPYPPAAGPALAESGRGLPLVQHCADTWGVRTYRGGRDGYTGKAVWFRMAAKSTEPG